MIPKSSESGNLSPTWFGVGQEKCDGAAPPPSICYLVKVTRCHAGIHLLKFCFDTDSDSMQRRQPSLVVLGGEVRIAVIIPLTGRCQILTVLL